MIVNGKIFYLATPPITVINTANFVGTSSIAKLCEKALPLTQFDTKLSKICMHDIVYTYLYLLQLVCLWVLYWTPVCFKSSNLGYKQFTSVNQHPRDKDRS